MKARALLVPAVAGAVAFVGAALWLRRPPAPMSVSTAVVRFDPLEVPWNVEGETVAKRVAVAPLLAGRTTRIRVREGERVARGAILADLDARAEEDARAEAEAVRDAALLERDRAATAWTLARRGAADRLGTAKAQLAEALSQVRRVEAPPSADRVDEGEHRVAGLRAVEAEAARELSRLQGLLSEGAIAQAQVDKAVARVGAATAEREAAEAALDAVRAGASTSERDVARSAVEVARRRLVEAEGALLEAESRGDQVRSAEAGVRRAEAALARVRLERSERVVRAPFAGVIARVRVDPGGLVGPTAPLVDLFDPTTLRVEASVPDDQAGYVLVGARATVSAPSLPGVRIPGRVVRVAPAAEVRGDTAGHVHAVRATIALGPRPAGLRPGVEVDIEGVWRAPVSGARVPDDAVGASADGPVVWRIHQGKVWPIPVRLGPSGGGWTRVRAALSDGDRVVVRGKEGLRAGIAVRADDRR